MRTWMRELEDTHLISQRRHGQGRTNLYVFHELSTAQLEVQDHHKRALVPPQEAQGYEEAVQQERVKEGSGVRDSSGIYLSNEEPINERRFTHSSVFSITKDGVLRTLAGQQTYGFTAIQQNPSPPQSKGKHRTITSQWKKEITQAHQLASGRINPSAWLPGYIVDFSREFQMRRPTCFERSGMDAEAVIE